MTNYKFMNLKKLFDVLNDSLKIYINLKFVLKKVFKKKVNFV